MNCNGRGRVSKRIFASNLLDWFTIGCLSGQQKRLGE